MKKLLALGLVFIGVLTLSACDLDELRDSLSDTVDQGDTVTYARLDINPSIEFIVDEDENIVSYKLLNEDAKTVAVDLNLEGMNIEEAIEIYLDEAVELGFLDVDVENQITVTTSEDLDEEADNGDEEADNGDEEADNGDEEADNGDESGIPYEKLRDRLKARVENHLEGKGIGAQVMFGDLDDELLALAEEYNIGFGRLKMIQAAVENDEDLDFETAIEMEMGDIMSIVRDVHREHMEDFRASMRDSMRERATERRDSMRENHPRFFDDEEEQDDNNDTEDEDNDTEDNDDSQDDDNTSDNENTQNRI